MKLLNKMMLAHRNIKPTLSLPFTSQQIDNRIIFNRNDATSCATYFNQAGVMVTQGVNLINNSQLYSPYFNTSAFTGYAEGIADPLGGNNACQITGAMTDSTGSVPISSAIVGASYVGSIWMRVTSGTANINIYLNGGGLNVGADQQSCAVTTTWQRFNTVPTVSTSTGAFTLQIGGGTSWGIGQTIQIFGMQVEVNNSVGAYTQTYGVPVSGPQLITNGTSFTNTTGWTASNATISASSGYLKVASTGTAYGTAQQVITTIPGMMYVVSFTAYKGTSDYAWLTVGVSGNLNSIATLTVPGTTPQTVTSTFIATSTNTYIVCETNNVISGATAFFNNISVQQITPATVGAELAGIINIGNGYSAGPTTTISNNIATTTGTTYFAPIVQKPGTYFVAGMTYFLTANITKTSGSVVAFQIGGTSVFLNTGNVVGTQNYSTYFVAPNSGSMYVIEGNGGTWVGTINSISIKQVISNPAGVSTSGPRIDYDTTSPVLSNNYGSELTPGLTSSTGWSFSPYGSGTIVIGGGTATLTNAPPNTWAQTTNQLLADNIYKFTMTVSSISGGNVSLLAAGGTTGVSATSPGTYVAYGRPNVNFQGVYIYVQGASNVTATITNVSVVQVYPATNSVELVPNGNFLSGTTNWGVWGSLTSFTANNNTASVVANSLNQGVVSPIFNTIAGASYKVSVTISAITGSYQFGVVGSSTGIWDNSAWSPTISSTGTYTFTYVSGGGAVKFLMWTYPGVGSITFTNCSVQQVIFTPKGLLIEQAATNLCLQSSALTASPWNMANQPTATQTLDLMGGNNGYTFTNDGTNQGAGYYQLLTLAGNSQYTFSKYVKKVSGTNVTVRCGSDSNIWLGNTGAFADFNLDSLTWPIINGTITYGYNYVGNGWYRIWVTGTTISAGGVGAILTYVTSQGAATQWGNQLELGSFPTTLIQTQSSTVSRAADFATIQTSGWYNQTQGTVVVSWTGYNEYNGYAGVFSINDGELNNKFDYRANYGYSVASAGGTSRWTLSTGTPSVNGSHTVAVSYITGYQYATYDSNAVAVTNSSTIPTGLSQLQIGGLDGGTSFALNGHITKINYYNTMFNGATLQGLT